ncbi:type II secretion system protein N [Agarivorans sp. QJM3NY_33]|uniref:type II secretion system protein N n=1 Tax=Agarivorans sp. QJM3NY_33 TaxID=3421432 RepID=UPI003D7E8052
MKKYLGLALLLISVYLVSLVVTMPLSVVLNYLPIPKQVILNQPRGSVWDGQLASINLPQLSLKQVHWQVKPSALLSGRLMAELSLGNDHELAGQGLVGLGLSGWFVKDWQLNAPASWLMQQLPLGLPVSVDGELQLQLTEASQGSPWCEQLQGQLRWLAPLINSPLGELQLANAKAELACKQGQPTIQLNHRDSQVELEWFASLTSSSWATEGKIKAGAEMPSGLSNNLKYIGRVDPQGYYRFKEQGRLPR